MVIFIELVAPDEPETLQVAEELPHLIWLVGRGRAGARETSQRLQILRDARCQLDGVVLNRHEGLFPLFPIAL